MENTTPEGNPTVTEKIARLPLEVGAAIVDGTQVALHEGARVIAQAGTVVIEATKTVVQDVVHSTEQLGHEIEKSVTPTPMTAPSPAAPGKISPAA